MSERAAVRTTQQELMRLDSRYPRPTPPDGDAPIYRVSTVQANAQIWLDGGVRLKMDGVSCSNEGLVYLSRMLASPESHVTFRQTRAAESGVIPAEVWRIDAATEVGGAPAYSLVAETALTSGWCRPDFTAAPATNERFEALAALGIRLRGEVAAEQRP